MDRSERGGRETTDVSFWRYAVTGLNLLVLSLSVVGALAALLIGVSNPSSGWSWTLLIATSAVYPLWITLRIVGRAGIGAERRAVGIVQGTMVAPLLVAIPAGVLQVVAQFFPAYRVTVARAVTNNDSFFSDVENVFVQSLIYPMMVWLMGTVAALAVILLVLLPLMAMKRPREAADGTRIEKIDAQRQTLLTRLVFVGLAPLMLGVALWVFSGGDSIGWFPRVFGWVIQSVSYGNFPLGSDLAFVLGVILTVIGGASVALGCLLTVVWSHKSME